MTASARAPPASSHNSDPSRATKMRSSTGCISQARNAVLAAATPINRPATARCRACGRMNSRARRKTSAKERAPFPRIAGYFRISSPPPVLEAGTRLGKGGGDYQRRGAATAVAGSGRGSCRIRDEALVRHEDVGFGVILYRGATVERLHGTHQRHPIQHFVLARSFHVL